MRNPSYLMLSRHNIYYFRWPLPRQIHTEGKTIHVKISLDTRDPKQARRLSTMLQEHGYNLLRQDWVLGMNYREIKEMIEASFAKEMARQKAMIDRSGVISDSMKKRLLEAVLGLEQKLDGTMEVDDDEYSEIEGFVREYELDLSNSEEDRRNIRRVYWMGTKAFISQLVAYSDSQAQFDFSGAKSPLLPKPENRLLQVVEKYMAEMAKSGAWGIRATEERQSCFDYLMELIGKDFDLPRFEVVTARGVKEALQKTPVNRGKLKETRDLTLEEQIKVEGVPTLSVGSINKYLQCYGSFFTWTTVNGYTEKNPFAKMSMKDKGGKKRDYFKSEQIAPILAEVEKGKSGLLDSDTRYWGVLIGLYTGARLNEIASLTPNDVKQDKQTGIWFFDINDEEEKKRLKTDAAKRVVPVHTEILRRGFLQYVNSMRTSGKADIRLLPNLAYSAKEGWGRKLGRWFNGVFLPKMELKKQRLSFHSLRHTVITNLRRAGVDNHNVRAIVGHEPDGVTEAVYTHDIGLPQLQKDIERLNYSPEQG